MCTQALPQLRARAASRSLSCIDRARAVGTNRQGGLKLLLCMPKPAAQSSAIYLSSGSAPDIIFFFQV